MTTAESVWCSVCGRRPAVVELLREVPHGVGVWRYPLEAAVPALEWEPVCLRCLAWARGWLELRLILHRTLAEVEG